MSHEKKNSTDFAPSITSMSGLLANVTSNTTYLNSAYAAFDFVYYNLYDTTTGLIIDGAHAKDCSLVTKLALDDTALVLEGSSILGSITGNKTVQNL